MAIQVIGSTGTVAEALGTTFRAVVVQRMPIDYGFFGVYRFSALVTTGASLTNAPLWALRWADATRLAVVQAMMLDGWATSAGSAGLPHTLQLFIARSFTTTDTIGTLLTLTGHNNKLRTSMQSTMLADIRFNSTALTGAVRTLDTQPIAQAVSTGGAANLQCAKPARPWIGHSSLEPIVLGQHEGLVVQATTQASASGHFGVTSTHAEVTAY